MKRLSFLFFILFFIFSHAVAQVTWDRHSLIIDGHRVCPVMGEIHYSRLPANEWADEVRKMKEGGVTILATYVFWSHIEEEEGIFRWDGQRNLRRFIEICKEQEMPVVLRLGPFCHGEVRNGGIPDWMFSNAKTMGIYGYVEAKGFNPNATLNPKDYESQVKRYLYLGNPVILTDGVDFILYQPSGSTKMVSICNKPINWENVQPNTDILTLFRDFFKEEGYRTISEKQLVAELSSRAKHLCTDLENILSLEEDEAENKTERDTIVSLKHLWDIAKKNHDKSLEDNHTFAGFVAQILSFALLYAHRFVNEREIKPTEKYEKLHSFWTSDAFKRDALRLSPAFGMITLGTCFLVYD